MAGSSDCEGEAIGSDETPAYISAGPTVHQSVAQAATTITRDNFSWTGQIGLAAGVTFGFRSSLPGYSVAGEQVQTTFSRFTTAQIDAVLQIVGLWSDVANITLGRVGSGNTGSGAYTDAATILLGNYSSTTDGSGAFTYYPAPRGTSASNRAGDLFANAVYGFNTTPVMGNFGWMTLIHELGHSLGLEHPGDYNAGPYGLATYADDASYVEDTRQYTVMSYFDASETGANHRSAAGIQYAVTPLLDDIAALQRLYGAKATTRLTDTVYGFNSTANRDVFRLTTAADQRVMTLYDSGGFDTLDLSGYATNQVIDLRPGTFSSTGSLTKNLSIAVGTIIERAIGGAGDDVFTVNAADDEIDGGGGVNTVVLPGWRIQYDVQRTATGFTVTSADAVQGGIDQLTNIQFLTFLDQTLDTSAYTPSPGAGLFDRAYYMAHNPDVVAAKFNAYQHYALYGRHEGRNPNGLFDIGYYLTHNPDVAATGGDPLGHYALYGWREGRDPSLLFSGSKYLSAYPEVDLSGADPLSHYMLYGEDEGRATFLTGGLANADPLVDAHYYSAQLGASLVPSGLAGSQQASWSYHTTGWVQGLNPDAWFDTKYYVTRNPDVAAAHVDPLVHFEAFGWREGRDPSAAFSVAKYLAANPDVHASGGDPLEHFAVYGQAEGRAAIAV